MPLFGLKKHILILILSLIICCASCKKDDISYNYPDNQDYARNSRAGSFAGKDLVLYDGKEGVKKQKNSQGISIANSKIWRSTVDVIGSLFPLDIVDGNSGVIATSWYQEGSKSNVRIKINALVSGSEAKSENIKVSVFREKRDDKKEWQKDSFESSEGENAGIMAKLIKEKILLRAKR